MGRQGSKTMGRGPGLDGQGVQLKIKWGKGYINQTVPLEIPGLKTTPAQYVQGKSVAVG